MLHLWSTVLFASLCLATSCPSVSTAQTQLAKSLSRGATVTGGDQAPQRWSEYAAPRGQLVVNVATEQDVAATVKYCNQNNLPFVAQNGGNGWADTFHLGSCGVIINLQHLNQIAFFPGKTRALIQGGVLTQDLINAAYPNNTRFAVTTCPCLGSLGASLGGGLVRQVGSYGWAVDQIEAFNIVLGSGELRTVTSNDTDLYWAVRGAGPNFGIVTSAVLKAYPTPMADNVAWQGPLIFSDDKLPSLVNLINNMTLTDKMALDLLFITTGPPNFTAAIVIYPFYQSGNVDEAKKAFAPLLNLGPLVNNATIVPYSKWDDWSVGFCSKGGRKPTYGASAARLDPTSFSAAYTEYKRFIAQYGAGVANTSVLVEVYNTQKAQSIGTSQSSFPWRALPIHTVVVPWYSDPSLDSAANAFGQKMRGLIRTNNGLTANSTYINFAHGDESLQTIYGSNLPRLQSLKAKYDPQNRFNQWYPLVPSS